MIRQRKVGIDQPSHHPRRRSFNTKHKFPLFKKRRSKTVIHVTIGLPRAIHSMNNNLLSNSDKKRETATTQNQTSIHPISVLKIHANHHSLLQLNGKIKKGNNVTKNSSSQTSDSTKTTHLLSRSSRVTHHERIITGHSKNKNDLSDRTGMTNDYHQKSKRNEKKKCSRRCFIVSLFIILLLLLIITAILLALLIKPKTTTPSSIPVLRWNTAGITLAGLSSNPGNANNQLNTPLDVILDYANNLYIVDYMNHRVQKYFFGSSTIKTVAGNGTPGLSPSQLYMPSKVILDSNENLYVSDTYRHRIQFWQNGAISGTTVAGTTNFLGNASNQLYLPYGIALNPTSDTLYISDYGNNRIMSYASGINNGTLVLGGVGAGITNTQLNYPVGLYFDSFTNSLVIANHVSNNIIRYMLGASSWTLIAGNINGSQGATSTSFYRPADMTFDPMGNMYVADRNNHRIQIFYDGQLTGTTIAGITSINASNATTLNWPWCVRLDSQLNLYVADAFNHRIQKFLRY